MDNEKKRLDELENDEVRLGDEAACAECDYEKALAVAIMKLDNMAANKAERLARGEVAVLRYKWKLAEVVAKANIRAQENSRTKINMLQSKLKYIE